LVVYSKEILAEGAQPMVIGVCGQGICWKRVTWAGERALLIGSTGAIKHYWQTLDEQKAKQSPDHADHRALQVSSSKK